MAKNSLAKAQFNARTFLSKVGEGCTSEHCAKGKVLFHQGDPADSGFFIQKGKIKVTVISEQGKEAVVAFMSADEFVGEACLAGQTQRIATATAVTDSTIIRLERSAMVRLIQAEPAFSNVFMSHLLSRSIRVEADLVDQLFNSSEKRLARLLLLLANFGKEGKPEPILAKDQPGNLGRNDRDHAISGKFLHEQVSQDGFDRLQRSYRSAQLAPQRCSS